MDLKINPFKDRIFASASLDYSIKLWSLDQGVSIGTLQGHKSGVNCI